MCIRDRAFEPLSATELERVRALAPLSRFEGELQQTLLVPVADGAAVLLVGRGAGPPTASLRAAAATALETVPEEEPWSLHVPPEEGVLGAVAEGLFLGGYRFARRKEHRPPAPGPCTLVHAGRGGEDELARRRARCEGMWLTRDLVNMPADELGPEELSDAACEVARRHGMQTRVWRGTEELLEQGFRMVEAVGRASARPSTVTVVEHRLEGRPPAVAIVGKGVVFDSGGLDIKPSGSMLLMRKDMGGAGTVVGALDAIGRLGLDLPLIAVIPAAENSVGPAAFRPGDILRSYAGLTVEIGNTDAEGRLLLADALAYSAERGATRLLDLATLTGAARVALGPDVPALFGNDEKMVRLLYEASVRNDEMLWRLPLVDGYDRTIDSPWADMNNISSDRRGGAITAALFLRRFVGRTPWSHIDLYAWEDSGRPAFPKGANGACVRTVVDAVEALG